MGVKHHFVSKTISPQLQNGAAKVTLARRPALYTPFVMSRLP